MKEIRFSFDDDYEIKKADSEAVNEIKEDEIPEISDKDISDGTEPEEEEEEISQDSQEEDVLSEEESEDNYDESEEYEDEEGPDPDSEPVEEPPYEDYEPEDEDYSDDVTLEEDTPKYPFNPATGVTIGILLPVAAVGSILLAKKGKRKRGRR